MRSRTDTAHHRMAASGIKIPRSAANARPSAPYLLSPIQLSSSHIIVYTSQWQSSQKPRLSASTSQTMPETNSWASASRAYRRVTLSHLLSSFTLTSHSPATSTGTTIVGVIYGGGSSGEEPGVCLGADTRATGGPIVADKNCEKVSGIYGLR